MAKQLILIQYNNGSSVIINILENYYQQKYSKRPNKKLHAIFMRDYKRFIAALNKGSNIVNVNKYLPFSNASISGKDILSIDIKTQPTEFESKDNLITHIPNVFNQFYFDLDRVEIEKFLNQLLEANLVEKSSNLLEKLLEYFNKADLEFTTKSRKKRATKKDLDLADNSSV